MKLNIIKEPGSKCKPKPSKKDQKRILKGALGLFYAYFMTRSLYLSKQDLSGKKLLTSLADLFQCAVYVV